MNAILSSLFLPRGRASRFEILIAAIVMLSIEMLLMTFGAQLHAAIGSYGISAVKALVLWIGCIVTIRRLHDVGLSGWWLLGGAAFLCMWMALILLSSLFAFGRDVLVPGSFFHLGVLTLSMLPAIGAALWLHLSPGDAFRNRFGNPSVIEPQDQAVNAPVVS